MVPDGKVGLVAEPNANSLADHIVEYFEWGEAYFIPHLLEEKKKYSWDIFLNSLLELCQRC
jgi:uncharacterized protein YutD